MRKEKNRKEYTTLKGLLNHKLFKQKLELVLVSDELQVTYPWDGEIRSIPVEFFKIINILVKADDGNYYRLQIQKDISNIDNSKTVEKFAIKKVNSLDVRNIGGFAREDNAGHILEAFYSYYRPKGKRKHYVTISKSGNNTITGEGYFKVTVSKNVINLHIEDSMTDKVKYEKITSEDLEKMALERGLKCNYIANFVL